jgi:2-methylcitrate dehydratase PrpD
MPPTTAKYLMAGCINQAAISAAYLAKAGHRGNLAVLDGEYGFWRFAGSAKWNADAALAGLGQEWRFQRVTTYKQYPICRIMHGALDGLTSIIGQHGLRPGEITRIHACLEASCVQPVFGNRQISNQVDAQFSIPYGLALVALGIPPGSRWQDPEVMHSAEVRQLMDLVSFEPHPGYVDALKKNPQARPSRVEVSARGRIFVAEREYIKGTPTSDPSTSLSDDELLAKFADNASRILPAHRIGAVARQLMALEDINDVRTVMAQLCP